MLDTEVRNKGETLVSIVYVIGYKNLLLISLNVLDGYKVLISRRLTTISIYSTVSRL